MACQPVRTPAAVRYADGELSVTGYRNAVAEAVRGCAQTSCARSCSRTTWSPARRPEEGPIDARCLLHALAGRYPNCWIFSVDGLVGATPELLLARRDSQVFARVLAGTVWPRDGTDADALAASLLDSAKNQEEHRYAVESLADRFKPFCADAGRAGRGDHAAAAQRAAPGDRHARQADRQPVAATLTGAVHPPAAVGGTPREAAVALITELEGMDRGRYAGPVGWIDAPGDGEFGIALRCAQVSGNTARLFAGGGIMADSDPDSEVLEANAKLIPMRDALESVREQES